MYGYWRKNLGFYARKAGYAAAAYAGRHTLKKGIHAGASMVYRRIWPRNQYGRAQGFYQGPFKKPTRRAVNLPVIDNLCLTRGYQLTDEIHGVVTDPDCVYVGHATWNREKYARCIVGGLIRKLFKKAGFDISNSTAPLIHSEDGTGPTNVEYQIEFQTINPDDAAVSHMTVAIDNADSLEDVVEMGSFMRTFFQTYFGLGTANDPYRLILSVKDTTSISPPGYVFRPLSQLNLQHEHMTMYVQSTMKVQNRTLGAMATDGAADRVDAQPLNGRLYSYKNADPRLTFLQNQVIPAGDGTFRLNRVPEDGLFLLRCPQLATNFKNPPLPKVFANINSAGFVSLEPGAIKQTSIHYKFSGKLVNVLKTMRPTSAGTFPLPPIGESGFSGVRGKCVIIGLQERLATNSTNLVTVSYERELKMGCFFTTHTPPTLISTFTQDIHDNPVPG